MRTRLDVRSSVRDKTRRIPCTSHAFGHSCSYHCTRSRYDSPSRSAQQYKRYDCENRDQGDTHVCLLRCRDAVVLLQQVLPISSLAAGVHSSGSSVTLQALLEDLQVQLTSPAPKLPSYVYVVSDTVPAILDVLDLWMNSSKSTHKMLESYRNMGALPGVSFALQRSMAEQGAQRRDAIKQYLLNMPHSELAQLPIVAPGEPLSVARSKIRANLDSLAAVFEAMMGSNVYTREVEWYNDMHRIFCCCCCCCQRKRR